MLKIDAHMNISLCNHNIDNHPLRHVSNREETSEGQKQLLAVRAWK